MTRPAYHALSTVHHTLMRESTSGMRSVGGASYHVPLRSCASTLAAVAAAAKRLHGPSSPLPAARSLPLPTPSHSSYRAFQPL
eukprot:scaffold72509_cov60-Phaeocystis_antarctica.AAC.3